jgi:UDP-glucose:(heptosyl)LPS alpha-1,3-glucosyltransferase
LSGFCINRVRKKGSIAAPEGGKTLKIAVLVKSFILSGGAERYAVEVTRRLQAKGHEIHLYARYVDAVLLDGIRHIRVPDRHTYASVANSLSFAREAARLLEGKQYDIVHSHERGWRQDLLTVHTFCYRSGLERYSLLRRLDQLYFSPRNWLYLWLEKRQMTSPRLVAVSEVIRRDIQKWYRRMEGVRVIPPGVDLAWFHPGQVAALRVAAQRPPNGATDELAVLFVGGEFKRKGLDRLIPAIGPGMRLTVVGRGEHLDHYRRLAASCGAEGRVEFAGHCADDIRRYYARADVVVLPSVSEAFGMSILEGMACGLPVVASPAAGVASLIAEGRNGFLAGEVDALRAALASLQDPAVRNRMGEKARRTAESYSWDRIASDYEEVYREWAEARRTDRQ